MRLTTLYILLFSILGILFSCKNDSTETTDSIFNVRIAKDPEKLNPVFNPTASAREIFQYIFVPLADFHPETLELYPILIERLPDISYDKEGLVAYTMQIKQDASWPDGTPITAYDYEFTIKAVKHPQTNARVWRSYINFIKQIDINPSEPKNFTVYVDKSYMLALEVATTLYILPKHEYDKSSALDRISMEELTDGNIAKSKVESDTLLQGFAQEFNDPKNYRDDLIAAGPYELVDKQTGHYYTLQRKKDYWGSNYPDNPFLQAKTEKLVFKIIPDEVSALTAFKDGNVDLMKLKSSAEFKSLKEENGDLYQYYTPQLMRMQYIALNNENRKLEDQRVRKALAHLIDVNDIINTIDHGYGKRSIGPFHPSKTYYNSSLEPLKYDPDQAKLLLKDAGWIDSDKDGDLDKKFGSELVDLELDFLISGSDLAKKVALLFQESAKQAGIKINIVTKNYRLIRKENFAKKDYDMAAALSSSDAAPDDPYPYWHSESTDPGEQNVFQYKSEEADQLIMAIRTSRDVEERKELYFDLQERIYEDQPVIFLYAPLEKILVQKNFMGEASAKRPGYLANTFTKI